MIYDSQVSALAELSINTSLSLTLLANESASRIGPVTGRGQGIAPTMLRLRKPMRVWWRWNVSFLSPGHFTQSVIRQQSLRCNPNAYPSLPVRIIEGSLK